MVGPLHVKEIRSILDDVDAPFQRTVACVRQAYAELDFSCAHKTQSVGMCERPFMKYLLFTQSSSCGNFLETQNFPRKMIYCHYFQIVEIE